MSRKPKKYSISIPSNTMYLTKIEKLTSDVSHMAKLSASECDDLAIVVTELVNNAIHHGNNEDQNKHVHISFLLDQDRLEIHIKDEGIGFNPDNLKDPLKPENLLNESGRGIFLIRNLMDKLDFKFTNNGTEVIATKYL